VFADAGSPGSIKNELALLQIRDQVSDAICVTDVDENDLGSIGRRRRELDAANADQSGKAMLGYIDASNVFHPNFVAALNN
jgi:hypothetical protein